MRFASYVIYVKLNCGCFYMAIRFVEKKIQWWNIRIDNINISDNKFKSTEAVCLTGVWVILCECFHNKNIFFSCQKLFSLASIQTPSVDVMKIVMRFDFITLLWFVYKQGDLLTYFQLDCFLINIIHTCSVYISL